MKSILFDITDLSDALLDVHKRLNYIEESQLDSTDKHVEINKKIDQLPRGK